MKRLLITGKSGFLGSRLAAFYDARCLVYAPTHSQMDITDKDSVYRMFQTVQPDGVIHCAAVSDVGLCEREPQRSWKINVDGSRNVAEVAGKMGAKCLLCSSDQVYFDSRFLGPHREVEAVVPGNTYGREKLQTEIECMQINPESVHLRLSWMYDLRSMSEKEHGDFARTLLQKLQAGEEVSYPVWDVRGITNVWEVIRNIEKAFLLTGGVYNFGAPNDQSTYETVCTLFREMKWDLGMLHKNETAFAQCPRDISMDQSKLNGEGIRFFSTLEGMIEVFGRMHGGETGVCTGKCECV